MRLFTMKFDHISFFLYIQAHRTGGVGVACWTVDRDIQVRFPAYPHRVWVVRFQRG